MFDKRFEGWYYKQSNGDITVAFIPGEADDGAFVQVITDSGSHIFRTEKLKIKGDTVKMNCPKLYGQHKKESQGRKY